MKSRNIRLNILVRASLFLAIAMVLPLLTAQIPEIGNALCPMHIPVILCGYFCGPIYALIVGMIAPLLRFLIFGMPPIFPTGVAMCFELAAYGICASLLYRMLPKKKGYIYISLIGAMFAGRIVWGIVRAIFYGIWETKFGLAFFVTEAFVYSAPGIVLQIILVPLLVMALQKYTYSGEKNIKYFQGETNDEESKSICK